MRRLMTFFLAAALLMPLLAAAEGMPEWEYPLAPEILRDVDQYLTLTNRKTLLDKKYVPEDLVRMTVRSTVDDPLRREANEALTEMFLAAEEAGYTLYVKSGYRSYQTQRTMYNNRLENNHGRDDGLVAYPGASDHQTGLGVDISARGGVSPAYIMHNSDPSATGTTAGTTGDSSGSGVTSNDEQLMYALKLLS